MAAVTYVSVTDQSATNKEVGSASFTTKFWSGSISSGPVTDEMRPVGERSVASRAPHGNGRRLRFIYED